jgi:predicted choloylglycine hydrolase
VTSCIAADRAPERRGNAAVATNHPHTVEWPLHARVTNSVEREQRILALLGDPAIDEDDFVDAFLEPPLRSTSYAGGFGTLYTAVHRPADGTIQYRWPGDRWRQSFGAFEEGERVVTLSPRGDLYSSAHA